MRFTQASPILISFQTCAGLLFFQVAFAALILALLDSTPTLAEPIAEGLSPAALGQSQTANVLEHYKTQTLAAIVLLAIQAMLIVWLLYEHRWRHNAEITTQHTMAQLEQLNRLATAGELSASIAHEVNQPLTGIVSRANAALRWLAADPPDIERARAALTQVVKAGHSAAGVISSVRALLKKDIGVNSSMHINEVIVTVLQLVRAFLREHEIAVSLQLGDGLPSLAGDPVQVHQLILNLVMNAAEAMLSIHDRPRALRVYSRMEADGLVHVLIEDSGIGIDPVNVDRVFNPLFTTKPGGMGMGLSICRSIVEAHRGQIWVSHAREFGSVFEFALPARAREA